MSELAAAISAAVVAACRGPRLGAEINIGGQFGLNQYQCDLACDPTDANNIAITAKRAIDETTHYIFSSRDGGQTWMAITQAGASDPDVVYDGAGNIYVSSITRPSGNSIGIRKSTDKGVTWSSRVNIGGTMDHPHLAVDRTGGEFNGSIYVAGRIYSGGGVLVRRSRDQAATWQATSLVYGNAEMQLGLGFVSKPVVAWTGALLIPMVTRHKLITINGAYGGTEKDLYVLRSTDGGVNFDAPVFVARKSDPASQGPGFFKLAGNLAISGYTSGSRLYLPWIDVETSPTPALLKLARSDDLGVSWPLITTVPLSLPNGRGPVSPSIAVNEYGRVGIQFFAVDDSGGFDLYFVLSHDAGNTWSEPLLVSTASSSMSQSNQPRAVGADQVVFDVDADGKFCCVWPDARGGGANYTLYMRKIF